MKITLSAERRSVTFKVATIAILILVLLIPIGMIENVVVDRMQIASIATLDIQSAWGGEQVVSGPILRLPFKKEKISAYGAPYIDDQVAYLLSNSVSMSAAIDSEERYRGIHKVPVYRAEISVAGQFDLDALEELGVAEEDVDWSTAELLMGISDSGAINEIPMVTVEGRVSNLTGGAEQIQSLPPQLRAGIGKELKLDLERSVLEFDISVSINGTSELLFLPLAETSQINASSNWPSPSFSGRRLPTKRDVREDGFSAEWQTSSLGRNLPGQWIDKHETSDVSGDALGVKFMQPIGLYQLMLRAMKYAVMFVGLTFVTYFLLEIIGNLRLHPMQYLLVGLANSLFYLLLLSLAEHIGFGIAYLMSAVASASLISGYSVTILARRGRVVAMSAVLLGLYTFLYLTLQAESLALLAGSIGLWVVLAAVMYLTRRIDWYASGASNQGEATDGGDPPH